MLAINLPADVNTIIKVLEQHNFEAYTVGGCVRDSILNKIPHDWDICTSATPLQVIEVFNGYNIIETGLKHGTVTLVMSSGAAYEITTYRIDGTYSDNRKPDSVEFTNNLIEDLRRRDFTINAIAYNPSTGLIDPFDGVEDIKNKIIRCVGNPDDRFKEDALRILRAWRFFCSLNFGIEIKTLVAMHDNINLLNNISMERIRDEFIKAINNTSGFGTSIIISPKYFEYIIPEWKRMNLAQNNSYHIYTVSIHTINSLLSYKGDDLIVKLAILLHDIGKPYCYSKDESGCGHFYGHASVGSTLADSILKRLKFDNYTRENVVQLIHYHDATFEVNKKHIKRWLNKIGELQYRRLLELRKADIKGQNPIYKDERLLKVIEIEKLLEEVLNEKSCFQVKDLAVNGNDLISIGYSSDKHLGETLNELLDMVIEDKVKNKKGLLLNIAKERL